MKTDTPILHNFMALKSFLSYYTAAMDSSNIKSNFVTAILVLWYDCLPRTFRTAVKPTEKETGHQAQIPVSR